MPWRLTPGGCANQLETTSKDKHDTSSLFTIHAKEVSLTPRNGASC
jgi:hypothetical protein